MLKKFECVRQDSLMDCGVCSLLTVVRHYGGDMSKEYLRELTNTTRNGVSAYFLLEAGKKLGFSTKAVKGDISDIDKEMFPLIAHVVLNNSYKHFVVIHNFNKNKNTITIADPAKGIIKIDKEEFKKISTDTFLLFIPTKTIPTIEKDKAFNQILKSFLIENRNKITTIIIFSLIFTLLNIITSFIMQLIIENVVVNSSIKNLNLIALSMSIIIIFKIIIDYFRNTFINFLNHKLDYLLIKRTYKHTISLPYIYYKNRTIGDIISRLNDIGELRESVSRLFVTIFIDLILLVFVIFTLLRINTTLTLILLLITVLYSLLMLIFNKYLAKITRTVKERNAEVNSYIIESIKATESIKGLNIIEDVNNNFLVKYNNYLDDSYKFNKVTIWENLIKEIVIGIGNMIIIYVATKLVIDKTITLGELITYTSLVTYFFEPIKNILTFDMLRRKIIIIKNRLMELFGIKEEDLNIDNKYIGNIINGNIDIKNLNYSYDGRKYLINNLNISIKQGEKVIISGPSGAGKSTLAKIIVKYLNIDRDKLLIDNKDINDYNLLDIRNNINYISQNENLFSGSLYDNICIEKKNYDYDEFLKVSKIFRIDEIIEKDINGYNMLIQEDATNISGGEKQRIILARALMKKSKVYIFDESLSQIDVKKERKILEDLFKTYKDKTFIIISHRFNNDFLFDRKLELSDGKYV